MSSSQTGRGCADRQAPDGRVIVLHCLSVLAKRGGLYGHSEQQEVVAQAMADRRDRLRDAKDRSK